MHSGGFMIYISPPQKKEVIAFNLYKEPFKKFKNYNNKQKTNKQNPPHTPKGK